MYSHLNFGNVMALFDEIKRNIKSIEHLFSIELLLVNQFSCTDTFVDDQHELFYQKYQLHSSPESFNAGQQVVRFGVSVLKCFNSSGRSRRDRKGFTSSAIVNFA